MVHALPDGGISPTSSYRHVGGCASNRSCADRSKSSSLASSTQSPSCIASGPSASPMVSATEDGRSNACGENPRSGVRTPSRSSSVVYPPVGPTRARRCSRRRRCARDAAGAAAAAATWAALRSAEWGEETGFACSIAPARFFSDASDSPPLPPTPAEEETATPFFFIFGRRRHHAFFFFFFSDSDPGVVSPTALRPSPPSPPSPPPAPAPTPAPRPSRCAAS